MPEPWLRHRLGAPVDGASLAIFRIAMGLILLWEGWRYHANDWIQAYWLAPSVHFTYYGFSWVRPLPGDLLYALFVLMGAAAVALAIGFWYRVAAVILVLGFGYQFLLEQARYLNHFYAALLFLILLAGVQGNAVWSLDRWRDATGRARDTVPWWNVAILRFQVGVIYVFAGIAKFDSDWLDGGAWARMLERRAELPFVRFLLDSGVANAFGYGSLAFDLLVVPALLWRRTRALAFLAAIGFHFANSQLFRIGIFPWMMIAATTLYLPVDWPRRLAAWVGARPLAPLPRGHNALPRPIGRLALSALAVYVLLQLTVPLRHLLYPGDVTWTEEGHRFSWRMMLRGKSGQARFIVETPGSRKLIDPRRNLTDWQYQAMVGRPDMILQYAQFLARAERPDSSDVRVFADVTVSLNSRPPSRLVDPSVDLASVTRRLSPASWIVRAPGSVASHLARPSASLPVSEPRW